MKDQRASARQDGNHRIWSRANHRFFGQDAQYKIKPPSYTDNGDETIADDMTGLMWQKSMGEKMTFEEAFHRAKVLELGGQRDWRLPNAKGLQSIADYSRSVQTTGSAAVAPVFQTTEIKDPEGRKQYLYFWTSTTHLDGPDPHDSAVNIAFGSARKEI